jgi:hypothetical protein
MFLVNSGVFAASAKSFCCSLSIPYHAQEAFAFFGAVLNVGTGFQFLDGRSAYLEQLKNGEKCGKSATEQ